MKTNYTIKNFAKRVVMVLAVGLMAVNVLGAAVPSKAPADGKQFIIALYHDSKYYALPHIGSTSGLYCGEECTLNGSNQVTAIDGETSVEDCLWLLTYAGAENTYYITYDNSGSKAFLYKTGTTGASNYKIQTTSSDNKAKCKWVFTSGTANSVTTYSVKTTKSDASVNTVLRGDVFELDNDETCYGFNVDGTDNSYEITLLEIVPRTVTFDAEGGSFDDPSVFVNTNQIVEASGGAGITLPLANPNAGCISEGWAFYGWATSQCSSSTTTAPAIVGQAGDTYYPVNNSTTLHAVYAKGEYTKITSTDDLNTTDRYFFAAIYSTKNYIMTDYFESNKLAAKQIDETSTGKYHAGCIVPSWCYTLEAESSNWHIVDCNSANTNHYMDVTYSSAWYGHSKNASDPYTFVYSTDHWEITNIGIGTNKSFGYYSTDNTFKQYTTAQNILIYKVTSTPYYYSNPSCCEYEVSVSESGSSHITSMAFSESSVATCGDAASRTITITVTPASGYSLFGTTKPVFTKTSGTVTATIGSVTDNGNGTFSYECTFNSNDNGAGTFAISPGQFTNYRTVCCTELGDIDGDVNITTDGCDPGEIKVTWKMEATTGIASQTLKVYDDTPAEVTAKRITSITPSTSNQTKTISGLDPCKEYFVTIENVSSGGAYCAAGTPWESDVITTLGYTYTVNATNCQLKSTSDPVPDDMCEGDVLVYYEATGTSILPDDITVTNAGDEGTGWWWDSSTGELGIDADYVTGNVVVTIFASCADYSFIYGTTKGSENNFECFSFVTGSTDTWLTDLWTIPSADQWTYVGEPSWNTSTGKSANLQLSNMPYALNHANNLGTIGTNRMEGAQGYLKICSNSSDANRYVGFIPAGYVFRWGTDGSGWNSIAFTGKTSAIEEEDWNTPLQTWTSSNADDYTYVGLKTSSGYVWANRSETRRPVFLKPTSAWDHSNAYFAIYYFDASSHTGWSAIMTDPDGDGIYEAWIPNDYTYTTVNFVRLNTNATGWGNKWNQTGDITLPSDKNVFTITGGSGDAYTGSWSLYDKKGTFHISANSNTNNWYCHFLPHHVLHYDANNGSGAPADQSIAINASPCQLTVSTTEPTRTGYTFAGWNESSSAASKDDGWDGGDTHTMSADVTLYAVWTANTNTPYTVKHYKQKLDGTYDASPDETDNLTGTTGASITPDRKSYEGFTAPSGTTTTILADGSRVVEYQYSRNSYALAWSTDGDALTGDYTKGTIKYGASITAPNTPTKTGYTFAGWHNGTSVVSPATTMPAAATTYTATWSINSHTLAWDWNGGSTSSESYTVGGTKNYGTSITYPDDETMSKTGYTFTGWDKDDTTMPDDNLTITAQWSINSYNVAVTSLSTVTISAGDIDEGENADVNYGTELTLSYSAVTDGHYWSGWKVTKSDGTTDVTASVVAGSTLTVPDYDIIVTAKIYGDVKAWCIPTFNVTGDVHLTSTQDVYVNLTSEADNLINFSGNDLYNVGKITIDYLDENGDVVGTKSDSPLRLYVAAGNTLAEGNITSASFTSGAYNQDYSVRLTVPEDEYNKEYHYKLRLQLHKLTNGVSTYRLIKTVEHPMNGRALPEKFVIAAQINGQWCALPADLATSSGTTIQDAYPITVNNDVTAAVYAPKKALYSGAARNNATKHIGGIRLNTETGTNDGHLQAPRSNSLTYLWRTSKNCSTGMQEWYLKSTDLQRYNIGVDPSIYVSTGSGGDDDTEEDSGTLLNRYLCVFGNKIMWSNTEAKEFRILPVTNEYTDVPATVTEWGQSSVILAVNAASADHATAQIETGDATSNQTITPINETKAKAKNFKVTLGDIDLDVAEGNEGKLLYINWLDDGGEQLGRSCVTIPRIVAEDRTANKTNDTDKKVWNTEVHVLPGATLTIDGNTFVTGVINSTVSMKELHVYPGATVNVSTGKLSASTLRLRNGWTRAGTKDYNVARVYIASGAALTKTTASMDYDIYETSDGKHYYPLAVPFSTAVSGIDYADTYLAGFSNYGASGQYVIKEYSGALRAENGPDQANNWTEVSSSANLTPGKGYIMTAVAVKGEAIIRVPLTFDNGWTADGEKASYGGSTKNVVAVSAYDGTAASAHDRHKGWNMLGVPFMSCYGNVDDIYSGVGAAALINGELVVNTDADQNMEYQSTTIPYVSVPSHDFAEYVQTDIEDAKLLPGWSFFVQVSTDGNLTFAVNDRHPDEDNPIYAPKRSAADEVLRTGIILSDGEASDKTTILISDQYSAADYEIGADLEKMFGNGYTLATYSLSGSTRLAYNAMSKSDAQQVIPIGYRAPAEGEYTYSLNPRYAEANFERVDLIDYQTGSLTNLMTSSYTFTTGRTQDDSRFALNVVMKPTITTDVENGANGENDANGVEKVIINDHMYIIRSGQMYDATGKVVKGGQK